MDIRYEPLKTLGNRWETVPYDNHVWAEEAVGDWTVALRLVSQNGHAVVSEVRAFHRPQDSDSIPGQWDVLQRIPDGGFRSGHLQEIHVTALLKTAQSLLAAEAERIDPIEVEAARKHGDPFLINSDLIGAGFYNPNAAGVRHPAHKRPGRNGYNDEHYLYYAWEYARRVPDSSSPVTDLTLELFEDPYFPDFVDPRARNRVAAQVSRARQRGYLSHKTRNDGKAEGHLTEKALAMIEELGRDPKPAHKQGG